MKQTMSPWFKAQAARFDDLGLRERIFLFLLAAACFLVSCQFLALAPAQAAHQAMVVQEQKLASELEKSRIELKAINFSGDAATSARRDLAALQASVNAAKLLAQTVSPAGMQNIPLAKTLVHLLRRHNHLTLLHMATLTRPPQARREAPSVPPAGVALQGLELTVSGAYPELTRYVSTLERELKGMRWGTLTLKSEKFPPEMTLQMFVMVGEP